nr:hypothetical protein SYMBAF_10074 [Serratia symbiotica]
MTDTIKRLRHRIKKIILIIFLEIIEIERVRLAYMVYIAEHD